MYSSYRPTLEELPDRIAPSGIKGLTNALAQVTANANANSQAVVHVQDNLNDWESGEHTNNGHHTGKV